MGAGNVKAVLATWSAHVSDSAFKVLVAIAVTTKDDDDPPVFWGGQESLATALGRRPPFTKVDYRAVDRAMKQLRQVGALVRVGSSAPGQRARHELRLEGGTPVTTRRVNSDATPVAERRVNNSDTRHDTTGEHPSFGGQTPVVSWHNTRRAATGRGVLGIEEDHASHPLPVSLGRARDLADLADRADLADLADSTGDPIARITADPDADHRAVR